jgi:hypothetical protein
MAMFEMALSPLIETKADLGRSGSELHAFKQVIEKIEMMESASKID